MTTKEARSQLQALGDEKLRAQMMERGALAEQFGVERGVVRARV